MKIHMMGIGGAGMSAIARVLHGRGVTVTGDDRTASPVLDELNAEGITVVLGHDPAHLVGVDVLAPSSAISRNEPEVLAAEARGIAVWHRGDLLNYMMRETASGNPAIGIAVAGTHGKSTTTGMLATILFDAGLDPTFIIGATPASLGVNARAGNGDVFVVEADEYDRTFLHLEPSIGVVTNVDFDHPDIYKDLDDTLDAFAMFARNLPADGALVACADDAGVEQMLMRAATLKAQLVDYGFHRGAWRCSNSRANPMGGMEFAFSGPGGQMGTVSLRVPGEHNVLNALAALATADVVGVAMQDAMSSLGRYTGAGRRFEQLGEANGVRVIDDYAHHPTEIKATLKAARERYPVANIWAVWQPHTFSRTVALMEQFLDAFTDADRVIVLPIYAAREKAEDFGFAANALNPIEIARRLHHRNVRNAASLGDALGILMSQVRGGDVVITLSAGDGNQVGQRLLEMLGH
jgi:UDP-N-acetylmuramate--alanine ligase